MTRRFDFEMIILAVGLKNPLVFTPLAETTDDVLLIALPDYQQKRSSVSSTHQTNQSSPFHRENDPSNGTLG
jgi:hypothetical protein